MRAAILSMGDELVLGQTVDTNSAWLSEQLAAMGIPVQEHVTIGDNLDATVKHLQRLAGDVDFIIASGGLGPTDDDLTRHALAKVLGVELELHETSLRNIEDFFKRIGKEMSPKNRIQAMIPHGCKVVENTQGTAPGLSVMIGRALAFFVPGVPSEMKKMFHLTIKPQLQDKLALAGTSQVIVSRTLHTFGAGESNVAQMLGEMMTRRRNPIVNITVAKGVVSIRINATAETEACARTLIQPVEDEIRGRLGDLVYGADGETLAEVVGNMLRQRGKTVATAESCTGGLIAKQLTDVPGSSDYFTFGWVVYSNQAKMKLLQVDKHLIADFGAVSEPIAGQLAQNARKLSGADYALGITGIAGPGGGTEEKPVGLVYICLADANDVTIQRFVIPGQREIMRTRTAHTALNMLRLKLK